MVRKILSLRIMMKILISSHYLSALTEHHLATRVNKDGLIETVGSGEPRIDYKDDSKGALLLEPSRTNYMAYSNGFDNVAWDKGVGGIASAPIISANQGISPDGLNNAFKVELNLNGGTTSSDRSRLTDNFTGVTLTDYTFSFYAKAYSFSDVGKIVKFSVDNSTGDALFTLTSEWKRFVFVGVSSGTNINQHIQLRGNESTSDSVTMLLYGYQAEQGSYPTSYIPTQGSAVTRDNEIVADMTGLQSKSLLGVNQGTWFIDLKDMFFEITGTGVGSMALYLDSGNQIEFVPKTNTSFKITLDNSVALDNISGENKIAISYDSSGLVIYKNGVSAYSTLSTSYSVAYTELHLSQNTRPHRININDMKFYNTRLSNIELQALTT